MKYLLLTLFLVLLALDVPAAAHLEGDLVVTESFRAEIALEPEIATAGKSVSIQIAIEDSSKQRMQNTPLWVRITKGDDIILASAHFMTDRSGAITISFNPPSSGTYELAVRPANKKEAALYNFFAIGQKTTAQDFASKLTLVVIALLIFFIIMIYVVGRPQEKFKRQTR